MLGYVEISFDNLTTLMSGGLVLVVTATPLETEHLHKNLSSVDDTNNIYKIYKESSIFYFGKLGLYNIIHVQTGMGSVSRDASIITVREAIRYLEPKAVIMIGIAFGVNKKRQSIGDVLVSEMILPYELSRVGEETIQRSGHAYSSKLLLSRFKSANNWNHVLENGKKSSIIIANILSGEKLIDKEEFRKELQKQYPTANGGEMEGAGLFTACDREADWILIKGICDFADGGKKFNKEKRQIVAINAAISASMILFDSPYAFDGLDIAASEILKKDINEKKIDSESVLFDIYTVEDEDNYIVRSIDNLCKLKVSSHSIWLYGPSGSGKSSLSTRNVLKVGKECILINLAGSIDKKIDYLIREIIIEISDYLQEKDYLQEREDFSVYIKDFYSILIKHYSNKELYIILDEMPIGEGDDYKEFTRKIFQIINTKAYYKELIKVKFVILSISNPMVHIADFQLKVNQYMKFIQVGYWNFEDISKLNDLISYKLSVQLDKDKQREMLVSSKGCPRYIKSFYRNYLSINAVNDEIFTQALRETEEEFYYIK